MMCEQSDHPMFQSTSASDHAFLERGFDPHRPIHTRGGEDVVLLTTNGPGPAPVIGIIFPSDGSIEGRYKYHYGAGKLHRWNYHGKSYDASTITPRSLDLGKNIQRQFSWHSPFVTRSGHKVKILTSERFGRRPYVGLIQKNLHTPEQVVLYYPDGRTRNDGVETPLDLINI